MECLHPVKIVNPTKYVNIRRRDVVVQYVPCGKCAACQQTLRNQWYYRAYAEFKDTIEKNGYVLFDCLTYSERCVPRSKDYISELSDDLNFRCFDYEQFRKFMVLLRRRLRKYHPEKTLRYFAATEYGTKYTKRPHIHILFYVTNPNLDSLTLSKEVSYCWKYGRTDGFPYKSRSYVQYNTLKGELQQSLRVCSYVSKYVMKDFRLQSEIDNKIDRIMQYLYNDYSDTYSSYDDWITTESAKKLQRKVSAHLNTFHRQSLGFGLSALRDIDIDDVMRNNFLLMPDSKKCVYKIPLPQYYRRKLFYEQVIVDGQKYWQPTELGCKYLDIRKKELETLLFDKFRVKNYECQLGYCRSSLFKLVDYVINKRGRLSRDLPSLVTLEDRLSDGLIYKYSTSCDKEHFGNRFFTYDFLGNKTGYFDSVFYSISLNDFIAENVYFDDELENMLSSLEKKKRTSRVQLSFVRRQELSQLYKELFNMK